MTLSEMGLRPWTSAAWTAAEKPDDAVLGRIAASLRGAFIVWSEGGDVEASARAKLMRAAPVERPSTGDWVVLRPDPPLVLDLLPRKTQLVRKAPGEKTAAQVLAANIDTVFLVAGLDRDFNPRRIERYLSIAWESGARPVVVLNKADLCEDVEACLEQTRAVAGDSPVVVVSAETGLGLEGMRPYLSRGETVALIGSSGVGKSALTNRLLGYERRAVGDIRESDGRGRHTTVGRELLLAADGWLFMDLPGIREIQLWTGDGIDDAFADVEGLIAQCRFADCSHRIEPGCAIAPALESGALDRQRYENYLKVQQEVAALGRRRDELKTLEAQKELRRVHKVQRQRSKRRR